MTATLSRHATELVYDQVEKALALFGIPNTAMGSRPGRSRGVEVNLTPENIRTLRGTDGRELAVLRDVLMGVAQENHFGYRVVPGKLEGAYTILIARRH
jgi:hypothetical protein